MNKFLERLNSGEILVADGATGSNLQKMGLKPGKPPEDLIIDDPDTILNLASSFAKAGFGYYFDLHLRRHTHADEGFKISGSDSRSEHPRGGDRPQSRFINGGLVAGSMGPVGALIKPYGPLEAEDVKATFAEQAKALAEGGVDLL
jgi:5-methyltetrahydrofolate--homocysteine methyltransferase